MHALFGCKRFGLFHALHRIDGLQRWSLAGLIGLGTLLHAGSLVAAPAKSAAKGDAAAQEDAATELLDADADEEMPAKAEKAKKPATKSVKAKTPAASKSSKAKAAKPVSGAPLRYAFQEDGRYVYEIEIVVDLGDSTKTIAGICHYQVVRADEDEAVLDVKGHLETQTQNRGGQPRFDPRQRRPLPDLPHVYDDAGQVTISSTGEVLKTTCKIQLPFLNGPLATLIIEPFPEEAEPTWELSNNLTVAGKTGPTESPRPGSPRGMSPAMRGRSRMGRAAAEPQGTAFASGAVETRSYKRSPGKTNQVKITKHLELKTQALSAEIPAMEKTSEGEISFDMKAGVPKKALFKDAIQISTVTIPLTVSYRLMSDSEVAKIDQMAKARQEKQEEKEAEATRPLNDADVRELMATLKVPDKARGAADRLAKGPVNKSQEQVAKALVKLLADQDDGLRSSAAKALAMWGTAESVPALIKLLNTDNGFLRSDAIRALAALKDERGAAAVAKHFSEDPHHASAALQAMGPMAEPYVTPLLDQSEANIRSEACKILAAIGTEKSRPALDKLTQDSNGGIAQAAKHAIKQIDSR